MAPLGLPRRAGRFTARLEPKLLQYTYLLASLKRYLWVVVKVMCSITSK